MTNSAIKPRQATEIEIYETLYDNGYIQWAQRDGKDIYVLLNNRKKYIGDVDRAVLNQLRPDILRGDQETRSMKMRAHHYIEDDAWIRMAHATAEAFKQGVLKDHDRMIVMIEDDLVHKQVLIRLKSQPREVLKIMNFRIDVSDCGHHEPFRIIQMKLPQRAAHWKHRVTSVRAQW